MPVTGSLFYSPFGQARFETPGGEVADFLRRAYRIVPAGEESDYIDIEAELNDLLRQGHKRHDTQTCPGCRKHIPNERISGDIIPIG